MQADIARADGAQDGVGQGMQGDVGVRMAFKPLSVAAAWSR